MLVFGFRSVRVRVRVRVRVKVRDKITGWRGHRTLSIYIHWNTHLWRLKHTSISKNRTNCFDHFWIYIIIITHHTTACTVCKHPIGLLDVSCLLASICITQASTLGINSEILLVYIHILASIVGTSSFDRSSLDPFVSIQWAWKSPWGIMDHERQQLHLLPQL